MHSVLCSRVPRGRGNLAVEQPDRKVQEWADQQREQGQLPVKAQHDDEHSQQEDQRRDDCEDAVHGEGWIACVSAVTR